MDTVTVNDLRRIAKSIGMRNYSKMNKLDLLISLQNYFSEQAKIAANGSWIKGVGGIPNDKERKRANNMELYYREMID